MVRLNKLPYLGVNLRKKKKSLIFLCVSDCTFIGFRLHHYEQCRIGLNCLFLNPLHLGVVNLCVSSLNIRFQSCCCRTWGSIQVKLDTLCASVLDRSERSA
jgi:hypothetical protein